jgi:hypothetical protein
MRHLDHKADSFVLCLHHLKLAKVKESNMTKAHYWDNPNMENLPAYDWLFVRSQITAPDDTPTNMLWKYPDFATVYAIYDGAEPVALAQRSTNDEAFEFAAAITGVGVRLPFWDTPETIDWSKVRGVRVTRVLVDSDFIPTQHLATHYDFVTVHVTRDNMPDLHIANRPSVDDASLLERTITFGIPQTAGKDTLAGEVGLMIPWTNTSVSQQQYLDADTVDIRRVHDQTADGESLGQFFNVYLVNVALATDDAPWETHLASRATVEEAREYAEEIVNNFGLTLMDYTEEPEHDVIHKSAEIDPSSDTMSPGEVVQANGDGFADLVDAPAVSIGIRSKITEKVTLFQVYVKYVDDSQIIRLATENLLQACDKVLDLRNEFPGLPLNDHISETLMAVRRASQAWGGPPSVQETPPQEEELEQEQEGLAYVQHNVLIRSNLETSFHLPIDFTKAEAKRLAKIIENLPFA